MNTLNKVILIGRLGANPKINKINNKLNATISLATSECWKDKLSNEKKTKTEWHRIRIFNDNLCNIVKKYTKKGSKIYIEGKIQTRKWKDSNNINRYITEIIIQGYNSTIILLDNKPENMNKINNEKNNIFNIDENDKNDIDKDDEIEDNIKNDEENNNDDDDNDNDDNEDDDNDDNDDDDNEDDDNEDDDNEDDDVEYN